MNYIYLSYIYVSYIYMCTMISTLSLVGPSKHKNPEWPVPTRERSSLRENTRLKYLAAFNFSHICWSTEFVWNNEILFWFVFFYMVVFTAWWFVYLYLYFSRFLIRVCMFLPHVWLVRISIFCLAQSIPMFNIPSVTAMVTNMINNDNDMEKVMTRASNTSWSPGWECLDTL